MAQTLESGTETEIGNRTDLPSNQNLETYSNPDLGITLQVPSGWETQAQKNGVRFIREPNVVSIDIRQNKLESAFTDISQYAIEDLNERQKSRSDFKLISSEASQIPGGKQAYKVVYTFMKKDTGNAVKILRFWVLGDNNVFTLAYDAIIEKYDAYLNEAQNIIDSLRIKGTEGLDSVENNNGQSQTFTSQFDEDNKSSEPESNLDDRTDIDAQFLTYVNESLRLKFDYPANWEKQQFGSVVRFISPNQDNTDSFSETFEASVFPIGSLTFLPPGNLSVDDVSDGFVKFYNQTLQNFEITDSKPTAIGNNEARLMVLKYNDENTGETQAMNLFTVNKDDIFVFSYYAQPASYRSYSPIITNILLSLEIL
jgi:hypothetical protein